MVHGSAPPIFTEFAATDLLALASMVLIFHWRFRLPRKLRSVVPKRVERPRYRVIEGRVEPTISSFGRIDQVDFEYSAKKYEGKQYRRVPVERRDTRIVPQKQGDQFFEIFNLNSRLSHLSKDYVAVGVVNSLPGIRYVVNGRKAWDLMIRDRKESWGFFMFMEKVFIGNQERRDMVAYAHKTDLRARLVSLSTRKVLLNMTFGHHCRIDVDWNPRCQVFSLFGQKRTPCVLGHAYESLIIDTVRYGQRQLWTTARRDIMNFFGVPEKVDRNFFQHQEYALFGDLIAVKYMWVDKDNYDRIYTNKAKYQFIVVYQIEEFNFTLKCVKCLKKITEGMFSAYRIDSFFFLDQDTLAMIMDAKVYLVDWKKVKVRQCVEISGLYTPLLSKGVKREQIFASYLYDRVRGVIKFSVGTFSAKHRRVKEEINRYITDQDCVDVEYYYSGMFPDTALFQAKIPENRSDSLEPDRNQATQKSTTKILLQKDLKQSEREEEAETPLDVVPDEEEKESRKQHYQPESGIFEEL